MGIFLRKSSRHIENENISCQMRQFSALKHSKLLQMGIQNHASLFARKWEFEQNLWIFFWSKTNENVENGIPFARERTVRGTDGNYSQVCNTGIGLLVIHIENEVKSN